ncbi:unnamed protein product [Musa acuminata subsp. malaccensis]|uniref:(wild Malaysian banana) hypothetical protein n=1 Tax=Musa acuminata subsp. malaccensis TaxID=214687 RepID=A0A804L7B4_MUSAM|nr:unnamed protein product [Musa acuminata subsp. malaccensis]
MFVTIWLINLVGNVYVKFRDEDDAANILVNLKGRYYDGGLIFMCFISCLMHFVSSTCRQHKDNACNQGGFCNFIHFKQISWYLLYLSSTTFCSDNSLVSFLIIMVLFSGS